MADGEGVTQFSQTVHISEGDVEMKFTPEKEKHHMILLTRNGQTGEDLSGVIIRFKNKTSRHVTELITDDKGI